MKSLKSRLAIWVFLPTVLISAIDLFVTYRNADQTATLVQEQLLKGSARIISEQLTFADNAYDLSIPPAALELFATKYKDLVFYSVRTRSGALIAGTEELPRPERPLKIDQETYYLTTLRGEPMRVIAYAHALPNTANDYAITQVAQTLHSHAALKQDLFQVTMREHIILLSIVVFGLVVAFRWTLNPLKDFGERLSRRKPGSLEKVDASSAPEELAPVIHALNDYATRLDRTLSSYEQFVANTAHHLRTSFAILTSQINFGMRSGELNSAQRELLGAIQKAVSQGTRTINQLLVLAAVEKNGQQHGRASRVDVNVAEVITAVMEELAPLAQQKEVELGITTIDESVAISAPGYLVREVISNLVDNSIQHMGCPGTVSVSLRREDGYALLSVIDTGPGIVESEREKIFKRFYRIDESKPNSSGLGLAIVKEVCDALSAQISLHVPDNGIGLQVEIRFPLHAQSLSVPSAIPADARQ